MGCHHNFKKTPGKSSLNACFIRMSYAKQPNGFPRFSANLYQMAGEARRYRMFYARFYS